MSPLPQTAALRRLPLTSVWVVAAAVAILAFGVALAGAWIDRAKTRAHELAELSQITDIEASKVDSYVKSSLRLLDLVKFAVEHDPFEMPLRHLLRENRLMLDGLVQLSFTDRDGIVRDSNLPMAAAPVSVADRRHFKAVGEEGRAFFVSQPVLGRVSGKWTVQVTRRIEDHSGNFAGAVVASIDLAHFGGIDGRIANMPGAVTAIVGTDGMVRARAGASPTDMALDAKFEHLMPNLRAAPAGLRLADNQTTNRQIAVAWRYLEPYELYVAVTLPESDLRAESDARAAHYFLAAALIALIAFGAAYAIDRRERAVANIVAASDRTRVEMARLLAGFGQDLREPIDALRWATDALSPGGGGTYGDVRHQRALGTLRAAGAKLTRALNDSIDWAALAQTSDTASLAAIDPRDWAKLAYESVRGRARDLDVACDLGVDVPEGLRIVADAGRLHRMTNALLVHALSAAGQGGRVGFSVGVRGLDDAHVELAIAVSANGATPSGKQSHLGDAVAKGFAQSLGGTIEHREAPGGTLDVFRAGFQRAA